MTEVPSPDRRTARRVLLGLLLLTFALKAPAMGLPLYNQDDWGGLEAGHRLLTGGWDALRPMLTGETGPRGDRPVPTIWWAVGAKLFGAWGGGFYAMALAVHLLGGWALFVLLRRLLDSTLGAAVGCAVYLFNSRTGQGAEFLGAIDGDLAAAGVLACLALWGRARESWGWSVAVGLIALVACSTKTTALALPGVLLLLDAYETKREDRRPLAIARRWLPVAVAAAIASVRVLGSMAQMSGGRRGGGGEAGDGLGAILGPFVDFAMLPTWSWYRDVEWNIGDPLRWLLLLVVAGLALRARSLRWRPALLGLGVIGMLLVIPYLFLVARGMGQVEGRHILLPSIGLAITAGAVAASLPERSRAALVGGVGFIVLSVALYAAGGTRQLMHHERSAAPALVDALRAAHAEGGGFVHIGLMTLDAGTLGALDSQVLEALVPGLSRRPAVGAVGSGLEVRGGRAYPFALGRVGGASGHRLLVEEVRRVGRRTSTRFVEVDPAELPPTTAGRGRSWDLTDRNHGWSIAWPWGGGGDDDERRGGGAPLSWWVEPSGRRGMVRRDGRSGIASPAMAVSPPVQVEAAGICGIEVERTLEGNGRIPPPQRLEGALLGGCHGLVAWSMDDRFADEQVRIAWMTGCEGGGPGDVLRGRLDQVPAWRAAGTVRRLAIVPAAQPGRVTVRRVELIPCEATE